jgi:hypothetical protein
MKQRYHRPYDNTKWIEDHVHEIEVHPGVRFGGKTLRQIGNWTEEWTMVDHVYFDHLKTGTLVKT